MYAYKVNADGETVTITKVLGPVDSANNGLYDIEIPTELGGCTVTGLGEYSFSGYLSAAQSNEPYQFGRNIHSVTIPQSVTSIGDYAFSHCEKMDSLTINDATTSIGSWAFDECYKLTTLSLGKNITTIGDYAFLDCHTLDNVTIPPSVTSIGKSAFYRCYALTTLSLGENIEKIGSYAFAECRHLTNVTIPEKVETIEPYTFGWCLDLKYITLPAGLTSFKDRLVSCPAGFTKQSPKNGAIYYNNDKTAAERLRDNPDDQSESYHILANRNFLYLCKVTFDARGGKTDDPEVPVYTTEKITDTKANELTAINDPTRTGYKFTGWYTKDGQPFNVNETAITEDITLYAGWEFDPNALDCHQLTVTGGTVTVKYDGSDVTSKLNSSTNATTGKKTYSVPEGAEVTVKLDKNLIPKDNVFDGWSTDNLSLPTGQDYKAESIPFTMNSDVDIAAQYRDAATDHTPDTAVCHPLTLKDGVITSVTVPGKDGADPEDITEIVKKNANEDGSFNVPEGATVSVAFDKDAFADSGLKFGHWDITGLDDPNAYQNKESFDFVMPAKAVTLKAMTQDASIEDDEPDIVGPIVIGTTVVVGGAVLGYQAYSLGAEFAGKLMALPYFPSNRSALAMMLWEDAGKPMPESELLYPDVGQEERDMDLQHAARWAMENELIPDLNDEGTAPEEMKFYPDNTVSKIDVLNAWQKAQELKQNA
nr:leucine-rich repeat protein [Faecalibacterium prausnitzii]